MTTATSGLKSAKTRRPRPGLRAAFAVLSALALAVGACDSSKPLPTEVTIQATSETNYTITLTSSATDSQVVIGDKDGVTITVTVTKNFASAPSFDQATLALSTNLGNFASGTKTSQTLDVSGTATVQFFPGTKEGTAEILAAVSSSSQKLSLAIVPAPVAAFTFTVTGLLVTFADQSTGDPDTWDWDTGDDGSESGPNPTHTYSKRGDYVVILTASKDGVASTKKQIVTAGGVLEKPIADFTFQAAKDSKKVNFADSSLNGPDSWEWDFGDGSKGDNRNDQNPIHTYGTSGNFTVKLTATNDAGSGSKSQVVTIDGSPGVEKPVAAFTFAANGLTVNFADSTANDPTEWKWEFGGAGATVGGTMPTVQNPIYKYKEAGNYTVTLTATNDAGSSSKSQVVTAEGPPTANFTPIVSGKTVRFTNQSTGTPPPTSFQWSFGDSAGGTSTDVNPVYTYAKKGTYEVELTAINSAGSDTVTMDITIP